jgi:glycosyltransferase involved in cell wall biosynthesis
MSDAQKVAAPAMSAMQASADLKDSRKKRVLVVMRIYSGLADSLANGKWRPQGVPAVYRFLEGLARRHDLDVTYIFAAREPDARFARVRRITMAPLGEGVWLLPLRSWFGSSRLGRIVNEIEQTVRVLATAIRLRPHVVYCTNAAFVSAGLLSRLRIAPVVLRFLGIFPIHRKLAESQGPMLARWLYRSPFARVICTLEGSGAEHHLPALLRQGMPCDTLLNGVNRKPADVETVTALRRRYGGAEDVPIVGFLGRLEPYKGCEEFVKALIALEAVRPGRFSGLIVGGGSLAGELCTMIVDADMQSRIHLAGPVPHGEVQNYLAALDIYVSLNRYGNLSNANLEAMAAGRCMVFLAGDRQQHIDDITARLVPDNVVERVPREGTVAALAEVLARLIDDADERQQRARATQRLAASLAPDWHERVEREIEMMLAAARPNTRQTRLERSSLVR